MIQLRCERKRKKDEEGIHRESFDSAKEVKSEDEEHFHEW